MKKSFVVIILLAISATMFAQEKGKEKQKEKDNAKQAEQVKAKDKGKEKDNNKSKEIGNPGMDDHDRKVWAGIGDQSCAQPSKNQPAKVTAAFKKDYPAAVNARWTKCRGDWTATFANGIFRSTAVYHANGDRKDTRTPIKIEEAPKTIFEKILKADPTIKVEDAVKIEQPAPKVIGMDALLYRIKTLKAGTTDKPQYVVVNSSGDVVKYDY